MAGGESFNRIPTQCLGVCELTQRSVDKHGIVLTRNCDGPSVQGDDADRIVSVRLGEVVDIDDHPAITTGWVACTNAGFNAWLTAREETYKQGTGE